MHQIYAHMLQNAITYLVVTYMSHFPYFQCTKLNHFTIGYALQIINEVCTRELQWSPGVRLPFFIGFCSTLPNFSYFLIFFVLLAKMINADITTDDRKRKKEKFYFVYSPG